jgi:hypothetical protein
VLHRLASTSWAPWSSCLSLLIESFSLFSTCSFYRAFYSHFISYWSFVFLFLAVLQFELRASRLLGLLSRCSTTWATCQPCFMLGFFEIVSQIICPGWLWTAILLISVSWLAKIIGFGGQL